ncbi:hypothetical protein [Paenibacillus sp. PL2-23]|uniref:hypothetical protein n=1 Tax=Paenibacillus sp. PL2-23 TaxID=2100729 RepID=UPI0030F74234
MRWGKAAGVTLIVLCIIAIEWPRLKDKPVRDKAAFMAILTMGWLLAMLDLPNIQGPTALIEQIFKPLTNRLKLQ